MMNSITLTRYANIAGRCILREINKLKRENGLHGKGPYSPEMLEDLFDKLRLRIKIYAR